MRHKVLNVVGGLVLGIMLFWTAILLLVESRSLLSEDVYIEPITLDELDYLGDFLEGVEEFGPFKIGERSLYGEGQSAPFDGKDIPKSEFYIYVMRRGVPMCEFEGCSIAEGRVVQCMGGWLSGDGGPQSAFDLGLDDRELASGKASIVVLADKKSKIIGIYPNHTEGDILEILGKYPKYKESFRRCLEEEIGFFF